MILEISIELKKVAFGVALRRRELLLQSVAGFEYGPGGEGRGVHAV